MGRTKSRILAAVTCLLLGGGCSLNSTFTYKPSTSAAGLRKLPVKVAVLPFADGTGEFTRHSTPLGEYVNLAKTGIDYGIGAFTPNRWGEAFAEELKASGGFQSVRFISDISGGADDEVIIAGTVTKADVPLLGGSVPVRFAVTLNARNGKNGRPFWDKSVSREDAAAGGYGVGCGFDRQCAIDRRQAHHNDLLRVMFIEARVDLAESLSSGSGNWHGENKLPSDASPSPDMDSVDETLKMILKGQ